MNLFIRHVDYLFKEQLPAHFQNLEAKQLHIHYCLLQPYLYLRGLVGSTV